MVSAGARRIGNDAIAAEIVRQLSRRATDSSICPSEVARALHSDAAAWRALMPQVRDVAVVMRNAGRVRITQRGFDVPDDAVHRGAIRLARGPEFGASGTTSSSAAV
mgnify:CR=1 FL=1